MRTPTLDCQLTLSLPLSLSFFGKKDIRCLNICVIYWISFPDSYSSSPSRFAYSHGLVELWEIWPVDTCWPIQIDPHRRIWMEYCGECGCDWSEASWISRNRKWQPPVIMTYMNVCVPSAGEKPFICFHCSRAFADRSNLRAHLQTHSEVKKYQCASCFKTFSRITLLAKHQEVGCPLSWQPVTINLL